MKKRGTLKKIKLQALCYSLLAKVIFVFTDVPLTSHCGFFTQVGMPEGLTLTLNNLGLSISGVNFNASLIGGMPQTQDVVNYCADNKVLPRIQIIDASQVNDAWEKVVNKEAKYRFVIDASTF